jgi:hypothetical protein
MEDVTFPGDWPNRPAKEAAVTYWIPLLVVVILTRVELLSALSGAAALLCASDWLERTWAVALSDLGIPRSASVGVGVAAT